MKPEVPDEIVPASSVGTAELGQFDGLLDRVIELGETIRGSEGFAASSAELQRIANTALPAISFEGGGFEISASSGLYERQALAPGNVTESDQAAVLLYNKAVGAKLLAQTLSDERLSQASAIEVANVQNALALGRDEDLTDQQFIIKQRERKALLTIQIDDTEAEIGRLKLLDSKAFGEGLTSDQRTLLHKLESKRDKLKVRFEATRMASNSNETIDGWRGQDEEAQRLETQEAILALQHRNRIAEIGYQEGAEHTTRMLLEQEIDRLRLAFLKSETEFLATDTHALKLRDMEVLETAKLEWYADQLRRGFLDRQSEVALKDAEDMEKQETIDLGSIPPGSQEDISERSKVLTTILGQASGPEKMSSMRTALANSEPVLPSEIRWDAAKGDFANAPGFEGRQRSEATMKHLNNLKPIFEQRDSFRVAIEFENKATQELRLIKDKAAFEDAELQRYMADGKIINAEEAMIRKTQAETERIQMEARMGPLNVMMQLMGDPTTMAFARRYGVLGQLEELLGFKVPFQTGIGGLVASEDGVPSISEWSNLNSTNRALVVADMAMHWNMTEEEAFKKITAALPQAGRRTGGGMTFNA